MKKPTEKMIIETLEKTGGLIKPASIKLNVARKTLYHWIENSPTLKDAWNNCRDNNLDLAEHALLKQINDGNITAIIFYLKTIGRERGYIEKTEIGFSMEEDREKVRELFPKNEDFKEGE